MNPQIEFNLALVLFLPWFAILAALYWIYPRQPRTSARRAFDTTALVVATALAAWGMHWSMVNADPDAGAIWKQVLASSISYGLFLLVMAVALIVRYRLLKAPARAPLP